MSVLHFAFGAFETTLHLSRELPGIEQIAADFAVSAKGVGFFRPLIICDEHTAAIADRIRAGTDSGIAHNAAPPCCVLQSGEAAKGWAAVETILRAAKEAGLGRDGVFIGVGGGVIGDLAGFAASIYMRGCGFALVSTTLLGMVDASLGGKTGFDLFGVKNLAGSFYPARQVYLPLESLASLPPPEWKSGMAELIKTAVLAGGALSGDLADMAAALGLPGGVCTADFPADTARRLLAQDSLARCVEAAARFKGRIVEADPEETAPSGGRALLNLGHTFGHALEGSAGLGAVSHGEAVAWGMARSCELGLALGITPRTRAEQIKSLIALYGYETAAPHPLMADKAAFIAALGSDKKKKNGKLAFIVPDAASAVQVTIAAETEMDIIIHIIKGESSR
jgi:3-dehydroquinate synthase